MSAAAVPVLLPPSSFRAFRLFGERSRLSSRFVLLLPLLSAPASVLGAPAPKLNWTPHIFEGPAPPPSSGPPLSAHAVRDRGRVWVDVVGIVAAYVGTVVLLLSTVLVWGRRLRLRLLRGVLPDDRKIATREGVQDRKDRNNKAKEDKEEVKRRLDENRSDQGRGQHQQMVGRLRRARAQAQANRASAEGGRSESISTSGPGRKRSSLTFLPWRSPASHTSVGSVATTVDESVLAADRHRAEIEMERLYAAVMEHDEERLGDSSDGGLPMHPLNTDTTKLPLPTKTATPSSPSPQSVVMSTKSDLSLSGMTVGGPRSNASLSSPIELSELQEQNHHWYHDPHPHRQPAHPASVPNVILSPPLPMPEPPAPTVPSTPMIKKPTAGQRPARKALAPISTGVPPVSSSPSASASGSASTSAGGISAGGTSAGSLSTLPLRAFESLSTTSTVPPTDPSASDSVATTAPPQTETTKTTVLTRRPSLLGASGPRTGLPVPYSPYMPSTPLTPLTPSRIVTRAERRWGRGRHATHMERVDEDDMVPDDGELWY